MTKRKWHYYKDWDSQVEWREFMDTNDPYKLIAEAKEARALLDEKFIKGHEFAGGADERGIRAYDDPNIKYVCSIGAVYYVQGHQSFECNLITALNKNSALLHPEALTCDDPDCDCEAQGSIVSINDDFGKDEALKVFDMTIAQYQAEIDLAESMAAQYADKPYHTSPFTYTSTAKPIVGAVTPQVTVPTPQEVHV